MGPMDCMTVADRVAAWLDGELSRSEQQLLEEHLERCTACQALVEGVAAIEMVPPPAAPALDSPMFWRRMDVALQAELAASERPAPAPPSGWRQWSRASLRVSAPLLAGYAALLLFAVLWGAQNLRRAQVAEAQIDAYVRQQEAIPSGAPAAAPGTVDQNQLRIASYPTHRGHL